MRFILPLLLLLPGAAALEWSEVLFDATGSDNGKEFIELTGMENLTGCTVTDSSSSDVLELVEPGNNIIMIVESDSVYELDGPTIYSAGKAIGNGLGNSGDTITIACNETLLNTTYTADIPGYEAGYSLVYDATWKPGTLGGTPGVLPPEEVEKPARVSDSGTTVTNICNNTLAITLGKKEGYPGDVVHFTLVTTAFASWYAEANDTVFAEGDTLTTKEHSVTLPASHVKLTAVQRACNGKQRTTRYIKVHEPEEVVETMVEPVAVPEPKKQEVAPLEKQEVPVTAKVIVDHDTNVVPWVSGFGMVTLLVSAALFFRLRNENDR
ncbi:MAG: hypothetical protein OXR66_04180 [Candidatus Woesearchaeota archaeon]|nr:hypothetical protein [Candidatus Woesearchaeota archaeon]